MKNKYLCIVLVFSALLMTSIASAAETKSLPVCVTYPQELPSGVPPGSIKMYNDFSSDDAVNTAGAMTAITTVLASSFGIPAAASSALAGGTLIAMGLVVRDYVRSNTNIDDLAMDMYINPIPTTAYCSINNANVIDNCAVWKLNVGGLPVNLLFYSEWDYIKKKSCCDLEACNTVTGVTNCIDTWSRSGVPLSTVTQCISIWSSS